MPTEEYLDTGSSRDVLIQIQKLLIEEYGCDPRDVTLEASFRGTMHLDSLDVVQLVLDLEELFQAEIPDDDAQQLFTVKDAVEYIENTRSRAN